MRGILLFCFFVFSSLISLAFPSTNRGFSAATGDSIFLADPTIFFHKGVYYLYGTGGNVSRGFLVYRSSDLKNWQGPVGATEGYALVKGDTYGTMGFWAPQVFNYRDSFYIAYTANEQIAIAVSNSPLGPFRQKQIKPLSGNGKQIDPFVFIEKEKKYLYHVRLGGGNKLYVAEMLDDLSDIKPETAKLCLEGKEPWENTPGASFAITEGPTVFKKKKYYYLFYSANDFRNIDYAVGYAVSKSPTGPWIKSTRSPIISRKNTGLNGTGHGDFIKGGDGKLYYVLHTHNSSRKVSPRVTAIVECSFKKDRKGLYNMSMISNTLFFPVLTNKPAL